MRLSAWPQIVSLPLPTHPTEELVVGSAAQYWPLTNADGVALPTQLLMAMPPLVISDGQLGQREQRLAAQSMGALQALAGLSDGEREAVTARVVDETGYAQVADELCVSESVVRKRVSRGLHRMRSTMETIT